jgi:hypothetical protein
LPPQNSISSSRAVTVGLVKKSTWIKSDEEDYENLAVQTLKDYQITEFTLVKNIISVLSKVSSTRQFNHETLNNFYVEKLLYLS